MMGVDAWTRTPAERASQSRAKQRKTEQSESMADRIWRRAAGQHKCSCGCSKPGTTFRDRRWYAKDCARLHSRASGMVDRTPPLNQQRKREIRKGSRDGGPE